MIRYIKFTTAMVALLSATTLAAPDGAAEPGDNPDLVLRGGTIYTGDAAPFRGDVAIRGDRIVYVGPKAPGTAAKTVDATGLIVAPGFIDPHAHVNDALASGDPAARLVLPFLTQGVTTAFIGVDGSGDPDVARTFGITSAGVPGAVAGLEQSSRDFGINFATYVGLGAVRAKVIGAADSPVPDADQGYWSAWTIWPAFCAASICAMIDGACPWTSTPSALICAIWTGMRASRPTVSASSTAPFSPIV